MISGLVLAAGTASRMGRPKQLLPFAGEPLLQHVVNRVARSEVDELVVVLGSAHQGIRAALDVPPRGRLVVNADFRSGQASSLRVGLDALDPESRAALVFLGDEPEVPDAAIEEVLRRYRETGGPVVRMRYRDRPGHPVLLDRSVWDAVTASDPDRGAGPALARHPEWVVHADLDRPPPISVDTPEDYRKLTGRLPPEP